MHFSTDDVKRLYGPRLYLLPELAEAVPPKASEASVPAEPAPEAKPDPDPREAFLQGAAIQWKMKAQATLALVLTESEFKDKSLTNRLKAAVLSVGLDPSQIGFGVYPTKAKGWNFGDMPVDLAVVCGACGGRLTKVIQVAGKTLIPAPALAEAHSPESLEDALQEAQARL